MYSESKTAIETDLVNVNATSLKIECSFLVGGCIQVTGTDSIFQMAVVGG